MVATLLTPKRPRVLVSIFVALAMVVLVVVSVNGSGARSASAASIVRPIVNAAGGVYWRSAPDWNTPIPVARHGVYNGDLVELECYVRGGTVPPYYNNPLWYKARVVAGFGIGEGLVNDHFVNTGTNQPNVVVPGVPACGTVTLASVPQPDTWVHGIDVGSPKKNSLPYPHAWGNCNVQDFDGGPYGWVIVSWGYWTSSLHTSQNFVPHPAIVRNGMLWGWFDQSGAQGAMSCPLNDEHDAGVGVAGVVSQDFLGGSLLWAPGMDHAVKIDFSRWGAVSWALHYLGGGTNYAGQCLQFVVNAYNIGQFHGANQLHGGPYNRPGFVARAYQWWYGNNDSSTHPLDTNAPFGSFVVWNRNEASDGSGHIALGLGGGYMLTTEYGVPKDNAHLVVHIETIAPHKDANFFGWEWPR